jgi:predicted Holliday junction resolvase-like endonuclease
MELVVLLSILACIIVTVIIVLAIIIYHQMLLINEVNKRIFVFAKEAIDKERITMEEYTKIIQEQNVELQNKVEQEETFNPHGVQYADEL